MTATLWPAAIDAVCKRIATDARPAFMESLESQKLPASLADLLPGFYAPLAGWISEARSRQRTTLVVGICGSQGSGKSSLCALLECCLRQGCGLQAVTLSIDDLYLTRADRERRSREVHPLFVTRGVPGTHDVRLGIETLEQLSALDRQQTLPIPGFDKAIDDRMTPEHWRVASGPVDVVLFEGWCVGASPEPADALATAINSLERDEDPHAAWRRHVNAELAGDYRLLFEKLDRLILLAVDSFERVFEWRQLQERKLADEHRNDDTHGGALKIMNDTELIRFIMHYERLTRHILRHMPQDADIVVKLDATHNASRVSLKQLR